MSDAVPRRQPPGMVYSAGGRSAGGKEFRSQAECDAELRRMRIRWFVFGCGALAIGLTPFALYLIFSILLRLRDAIT